MDNVIKLEKNILENAKISACRINDKELRIKAYALNVAANVTAQYLDKMGLESDTSLSLYKIPSFEKEFELADVYVDGFRFDTRISFDGKTFAVPKVHAKYGATPLAYIVVKLDEKLDKAEFLGFVPTENLELPESSTEYHILSTDVLKPMSEIRDLLDASTLSIHPYSASTHEKIKELSASFIDGEISESEKIFLIKHVVACPVCRETFCDINDFDTIVSHIKNYKELLNDSTLSVLSGNKQEVEEAALVNMAFVENAEENTDTFDIDEAESVDDEIEEIVDLGIVSDDTGFEELNSEEEQEFALDESEDLMQESNQDDLVLIEDVSESVEIQETSEIVDEDKEEITEEILEEDSSLDGMFDSNEDDMSLLESDEQLIEEESSMLLDDSIELENLHEEEHLGSLEETVQLNSLNDLDNEPVLSEVHTEELVEHEDILADLDDEPLVNDGLVSDIAEQSLFATQEPIELNCDDTEETLEPEDDVQELLAEDSVDDDSEDKSEFFADDIEEEPLEEKDSLEKIEKQMEQEELESLEDSELNVLEEESDLSLASDIEEESVEEKDSLEKIEKQIEQEELQENNEISEPIEHEIAANDEIQNLLDDDLMALLSEDDDENIPSDDSVSTLDANEDVVEENVVQPNISVEENVVNDDLENNIVPEETEIVEQSAPEETIEELFDAPEEQPNVPVFEIAEDTVGENVVKKTKNLAIVASLLILLLAAGGSVMVFNKHKSMSNNDIQNNEMFDFQTKAEDEALQAQAVSQDINRSMTNSFSDKPVAITITKLSWQVSEKLALEPSVKEYLQTAGKNIQMNLQNDLANSADIAFNNVVKVAFTIAPDNTLKGLQILESSGSDKIDLDISTSIKNTLKYVSVPKLDNYKSDYFLTLIINF